MHIKAPAKINLYLHITGRRDDGYHTLESLIGFTSIEDNLEVTASDSWVFEVVGGFSSMLAEEENIIEKTAKMLASYAKIEPNAHISLHKHIPIGAGLGGGSADAAVALLALIRLWNLSIPIDVLMDMALSLGADVPVFMKEQAALVSGIGEVLEPVPSLPPFYIVLVNPGVHLSTPHVFKQGVETFSASNIPSPSDIQGMDTTSFIDFLKGQRNDLEPPALHIVPVIAEVLDSIASQDDCAFSRMSGSGSTCFGVFSDQKAASEAAIVIKKQKPEWWVQSSPFLTTF